MSENFRHILENVKQLNSRERALMAHIIIASLESVSDEDVDKAWAEIAEKRFTDLINGQVKPVHWEQIKQDIVK